MGLFDFFKKKEEKKESPSLGFDLSQLKPGDILEMEGDSWEVVDRGYYDYGDEREWDWKIASSTKEGFLNQDEEGIYLFWREDIKKVFPHPPSYLKENEDLPYTIKFDTRSFELEFSGAAYYVKGEERSPVIIWDYADEEGNILEILQWGDDDFEVFLGRKIEEWEIEDVFKK